MLCSAGLRGLSCLLVAATLLGACALASKGPAEGTAGGVRAAPAPPAPLFAFLASATAGEAGSVEDPRTGARVWVIADRFYHAASGRYCRRFHVMSPQAYDGVSEGLACRNEGGEWTMSKSLINPDDLEAPRRRFP